MHPDHVAKLLKSPRLAGAENTPVPTQPSRPVDIYDAAMDTAFEQAAATYEAGKSNWRYDGESPLQAISVHPVGRLWLAAWEIRLLGGWDHKAREHANLLLPVLRNSESPFVLDLVFRALRSIHKNSQSSLGPELTAELGEALENHAVRM
jgi:hypothetical protein